jgi:hypothetical protein
VGNVLGLPGKGKPGSVSLGKFHTAKFYLLFAHIFSLYHCRLSRSARVRSTTLSTDVSTQFPALPCVRPQSHLDLDCHSALGMEGIEYCLCNAATLTMQACRRDSTGHFSPVVPKRMRSPPAFSDYTWLCLCTAQRLRSLKMILSISPGQEFRRCTRQCEFANLSPIKLKGGHAEIKAV